MCETLEELAAAVASYLTARDADSVAIRAARTGRGDVDVSVSICREGEITVEDFQ